VQATGRRPRAAPGNILDPRDMQAAWLARLRWPCQAVVENSIDGIEDLRLAHAPAAVIDQIFKNAPFAPRQ